MSQRWDPVRYAANARFVADLAGDVVALLHPRPGERILDAGCGDGALTAQIAASGAEVVAVDASPEMVDAARERGLDARVADVAALPFERAFDAVFSNATLHWVADQPAAVGAIARALRPGGRFVAEFGAHGNCAAIGVALAAVLARRGVRYVDVTPWTFPTADAFRAQLEAAGFAVEAIGIHPRPTALATGMTGWLATFGDPFFGSLSSQERAAAEAETIALLRPVLCDERGAWTGDYVRLRVAARLQD